MNDLSAGFAQIGHRPARFTTAEFLRMAEVGAFENMKVELIDGEIERMTPPMGTHGSFQARVIIQLGAVAGARVMGETGIDLGHDTVLGCDAALLHAPMTEHRLLRPDEALLVIEVAHTTLDRDTGLKRAKYASAGISHYWVMDTEARVTLVFGRPADGDYADRSEAPFSEPLPVPGTDAGITLA